MWINLHKPKKNDLLLKAHISLVALSTEEVMYMSAIQMKSLWQDLSESREKEQNYLTEATRRA